MLPQGWGAYILGLGVVDSAAGCRGILHVVAWGGVSFRLVRRSLLELRALTQMLQLGRLGVAPTAPFIFSFIVFTVSFIVSFIVRIIAVVFLFVSFIIVTVPFMPVFIVALIILGDNTLFMALLVALVA